MTVLPDPEPDWKPAFSYQGGNSNPARQRSIWEQAARHYREIAILRLELHQVAHRLRLHIESGIDELGEIEAAFFTIDHVDFMVFRYLPDHEVIVGLRRGLDLATLEALDLLLRVLGADRGVIASIESDGTWQFSDG